MPYYEVSNLGNFRILEHTILVKNKYGYKSKRRIKAHPIYPRAMPRRKRNEAQHYLRIGVRTREGLFKDFLAHRLIAETFIPNPENKPQVDHINEIKTDNRVENLRWATNRENHNHGTGHTRASTHPNTQVNYKKLKELAKERQRKAQTNRPKRYLVVGDIHAKPHIVDKIQKFLDINDYDKVIFMGDYVDDWNASPEKSYLTLKKLIDLKTSNPEKIILISGNHCQSYASAGSFRCSGFNEETRSLVKDLYKTALDGQPIFQFAFAKGNYLFTHAGLTGEFWKRLRFVIRTTCPELKHLLKPNYTAKEVAGVLNICFQRGFYNQTDELFQLFAQAGQARGGRGVPSPIWADKTELLADPAPKIRQVVGHTPVKTITFYPPRGNRKQRPNLIFCDTISTWFEPYTGLTFNIGDSSLLQLNFNKLNVARINVIPKEDWLTS